jgi:hypothetical protein
VEVVVILVVVSVAVKEAMVFEMVVLVDMVTRSVIIVVVPSIPSLIVG